MGYDPDKRDVRPVTGYSCWAMGYTDPEYRQPGCLLHPSINNGEDLRYRIDYGSKCMRESCHEARIFERLNNYQKAFWLNLAHGMDSFEYSSRKANPLFNILGWGENVLSVLADKESGNITCRLLFSRLYPFFLSNISAKGHAYLLTCIVNEKGVDIIKGSGFEKDFRLFSSGLTAAVKERFNKGSGRYYVYKMGADPLFTDFLRIIANIKKTDYPVLEKIKHYTDDMLKLFCMGL